MTTVEPVGEFAKDPAAEDFLAKMNAALAGPHDLELSDPGPAPPTLHVVGAPRTGTTLLTQLVAAHLDVGFVDHVAASFWRAPLFGLRLSRKLFGADREISYRSQYGRTSNVQEPHEFGYFWRDLLGYRDMTAGTVEDDGIDWTKTRSVLRSMTADEERPIVFKSFLFGLHVARATAEIPETCFVWMRRDPVATAMSILRFREGFAGDRDTWVSVRPADYDRLRSLPRAEQVVAQIRETERVLQSGIERADPANVLILDYSDLCTAPGEALDQVIALLAGQGTPVTRRSEPPLAFPVSGIGDPDDPDLDAVRRAVAASAEA